MSHDEVGSGMAEARVPEGGALEIRLTVNGEPTLVQKGSTVSEIVSNYGASNSGIAVALNREVLSRGTWGNTKVTSGDAIEIVTAAAGG